MRSYKVNSINVNLGSAIKYANIPANRRGHKVTIKVGLVDESGRTGTWKFRGTVVAPLGDNVTPAIKAYVEGCINATDGMFNDDTRMLVYDVLNDHNLCQRREREVSKYCFEGDKIVVRA